MDQLVTICIPAYNADKTIAKTLDSILNQTYSNIEIIVSDNHSTDNTVGIVKSYENRRVKLVTCPYPPVSTGSLLDNTYSAAQNWNSLINYGTGKYIGIYHADDIFAPTIIEKQIKLFAGSKKLSAVFALPLNIDEDGNELGSDSNSNNYSSSYEIFDQIKFVDLLANKGSFFSSSGILINRDAWLKNGSFNINYGHALDTEFWIRLAKVSPIAIIYEQLVYYRISTFQDSSRWLKVYRYSNTAFLPVLDYYSNIPEIKEKLSKSAFLHLNALRGADAFRIAINYAQDNNKPQLKFWLKKIWIIPLMQLFPLYKLHKRKYLTWIIAGKIWYLSVLMRVGWFVEFIIRRIPFLNS